MADSQGLASCFRRIAGKDSRLGTRHRDGPGMGPERMQMMDQAKASMPAPLWRQTTRALLGCSLILAGMLISESGVWFRQQNQQPSELA